MQVQVRLDGTIACGGFSATGTNLWVALNPMVLANPSQQIWPYRPALTSGWVAADSGEASWPTLRYAISNSGVLSMWGLISNGTATICAAGAIPVTYRPDHNEVHFVASADVAGVRANVNTDGSIVLGAYTHGGSNAYVGMHLRWLPKDAP